MRGEGECLAVFGWCFCDCALDCVGLFNSFHDYINPLDSQEFESR